MSRRDYDKGWRAGWDFAVEFFTGAAPRPLGICQSCGYAIEPLAGKGWQHVNGFGGRPLHMPVPATQPSGPHFDNAIPVSRYPHAQPSGPGSV